MVHPMTEASPAISFEEIRDLIRKLPGPDLEAGTAARLRETQLTKPAGALGRLEDIAYWVACWQGRHPPDMRHPRVAIFAGNHGVAKARGVSAYPVDVTAQMVTNFQNGGAAVNQLCRIADSDLRVYELDLENPTDDFTRGPAMSDEACLQAMAYGMMAVEPGLHLICLGEMGIGNTTSAAAICTAIFGGSAADWVGPGTGVDAEGIERKIRAVEDGIEEDIDEFAAFVDETLAAEDGWTAGGLRFQRVPPDASYDFTVYLATGETAADMCAAVGVDIHLDGEPYTSCRGPGQVILNLNRWRLSVPEYVAAEVPLVEYRRMVLNHEVGHELGYDHERCPGAGEPAPVMQQQTLFLDGCEANPWPYLDGRRYAGPPA